MSGNLDPVLQSEVSQKEKKYCLSKHIHGILKKNGTDAPIGRAGREMQMLKTYFWTQHIKERVGQTESVALTHIDCHV